MDILLLGGIRKIQLDNVVLSTMYRQIYIINQIYFHSLHWGINPHCKNLQTV